MGTPADPLRPRVADLASAALCTFVFAATALAGGNGPTELFPFRRLPIGAGPLGSGDVATAALLLDLGGDGTLDLLSAHRDSGRLVVTRGEVDGQFEVAVPHPYGVSLRDLESADITGDGVPDLVLVDSPNPTALRLLVVPVASSGHLGAAVSSVVPLAPQSQTLDGELLVLGDLDGDGVPDAVVAGFETDKNRVAVAAGHASGSFGPFQYHLVGKRPRSLALADMNGDGLLDLLSTLYTPTNNGVDEGISLSTGDGAGGFFFASTKVGQGVPMGLHVADLDLDGDLDVVLPMQAKGAAGDALLTWLGSGTGALLPGPSTLLDLRPDHSLCTDLDGDGLVDVLVVGEERRASLRGQLGGGFGLLVQEWVGTTARVLVADVDGDGRNDALQVDDDLLVRPGLRALRFESTPSLGEGLLPSGTEITQLRSLDIDQDGLMDLVALVANQSWLALQRGLPGGGLDLPTPFSVPVLNAQDLAVVDMDQDGHLDMVVSGGLLPTTPAITVLHADGSGGFSASVPVTDGSTGWLVTMVAGDLDGDGFPDAMGEHYGILDRFDNDGAGGLLPPQNLLTIQHISELELADLDLDGRLDLVVCSRTEGLWTAAGLGGGAFAAPVLSPETSDGCVDVAIDDTDGDGFPDLVLASARTEVMLLPNAGDGSFPTALKVDTHVPPRKLAWVDLDRDEQPELLYSDGLHSITLLQDAGAFVAPEPLHFDAPGCWEFATIDLDGDGDLDVVSVPQGEIHFDLLVNQVQP